MKKLLGFLTVFGLVLVLGTSPTLAVAECEDSGDFPTCGGSCSNPGDTCVPEMTGSSSCVCMPGGPGMGFCGDNVINQAEECDGSAPNACPGDCIAPGQMDECMCARVCGDNVVNQPSEECDGSFPNGCPGGCIPPGQMDECRCAPICGDDMVNQPSEECDGTADKACPGGCIPPGQMDECRCAPICGDDMVNQPSEECDGTADKACPGKCDPMCVCVPPEGACCTDGPGIESECIITTQKDCETNHKLYVGDGTVCLDLDCVFLLATMESMSAKATPQGVLLTWTTAAEVDTVGFRLLRELPGVREKALKVIAPMIPASGDGLTGATYVFLDNTLRPGLAAQYYVEDIDIFGKVTRHGPIVVERVAPKHPDGNRRVVPKN